MLSANCRSVAGRIGTRPAILLGLVLYGVVSILGFFMTTGRDFFVLAALVLPNLLAAARGRTAEAPDA